MGSLFALLYLAGRKVKQSAAPNNKGMMPLHEYRQTEWSQSIARGPYLNHAGVAPTPARVVQAVQEAIAWSGRDPEGFFLEGVMEARESARQKMGRLLGAPPEEVAILKNTGQGLALVADALRLEPGDNVVSVDCEYPSVVYPWYAQADRGIQTRLAPCRPDGAFTVDDIAARMDARTRVLTLSWVQFSTGYRADLAAFAALAHAHGALFVVDVIQGLGVLPLRSEEWGLDIVATGVHKWLLAPGGTGALYVAPHALEKMRLLNMGAAGVTDVAKFNPLAFAPKPNAQRYEEGTPNGIGVFGLDAALGLIEDVGVDTIAARVLALTAYAATQIGRKGYQVLSPRDDHNRAGILAFRHPAHDNTAVLDVLAAAGVTAAVRGGRLRFSPHFYNTEDDIDRAVAALPA